MNHPQLFEPLIEVLEAVGAPKGLVYVSVPITSGRREFELLRELRCDRSTLRSHHRDRWLTEVVKPNEAAAFSLAEIARRRHPDRIVLDPSRLHVTSWSQADFDQFWHMVIKAYCELLIVDRDWAFSRGARLEVALALAGGIPVQDPTGSLVTADVLLTEARSAESALEEWGWSSATIEEYLPPFVELGPSSITADRALIREPNPNSAAAEAFAWLVAERHYQVGKFGFEMDDVHTRVGLDEDSWWWQQLTNYIHRANVLGLDNPLGRQALAKFAATACGLLESAIRIYGSLPSPGVPSGEVRPTGTDPADA